MRKIQFDLQIADGWNKGHIGKLMSDIVFDSPKGEVDYIHETVIFEPQGGDIMKEAEQALSIQMNINHPGKEYRIEYWWWMKDE